MSRNGFESETEGSTSDQVTGRSLPSYQPLVLALSAMAGGILLDRALDLDAWMYVCLAIVSCAAWYVLFAKRVAANAFGNELVLLGVSSCLLSISVASTAALWHHGRWNWIGTNNIAVYATEFTRLVCLDAKVVSEPRWQAVEDDEGDLNAIPLVDRTRVELKPIRIRDGLAWVSVSGKVDLIIHERCDHFRSGDRIRVYGSVVAINGPTNPGQFDFRKFYRCQGKTASLHALHAEAIVVINPASNWSGSRLLSTLRRKLNEITWRYVSPQRAGLASAVLLGNRSQLTSSRREQFLMTGTVHLLAISGLHVGILSGVFFFFFRIGLIRRETFLWSTILFVVFYAWLVEFRPPVSRATILIVLLCVGRLKGQPILSFNWLAAAGCVVLAINPSDLFQLGPQLSFLAVATLTFGRSWLFWPPSDHPIKRLIASARPFHVRLIYWLGQQLRTAILVSGLIWLVAMPMVAYRFNLVAPVALIVNPILLLPIALALYGGLGVLVFGWFSGTIARMFGWFCDWNLGLIEWMISIFSGLPMSHDWTAGPTLVAVACFYVGVFFLAVFPGSRVSAKWFLLFMWLWLVFCWWVPDAMRNNRRSQTDRILAVTFADVGHGTGILIELPDGRSMLYDAGSLGATNYGARNIASLLWNRRIEHLDAIVLSHADVDHFNAMPQLCEKFSIGVVYMSAVMREDPSPSIKRLLRAFETHNVPVKTLARDDQLLGTKTRIQVLAPPEFGTGGSDNSNSVVLLVEFKDQKLLLTGDLESTGMELLLSHPRLDVDVLMAPHHGSVHSSPTKLTNWCQPEFVVISGSRKRVSRGIENKFNQLGASVYRTDRDGAIRFEFSGAHVAVRPFRSSQQGDKQKVLAR